jgi:hypothetical protein
VIDRMARASLTWRWYARKYGLTAAEARAVAAHPRIVDLEIGLDAWRERHGWPAAASPLTRGRLLEIAGVRADETVEP